LAGGYWSETGGWWQRLLAAVLAAIIIAQVALAIRMTMWSADLFDALERRSTDRALEQIGVFIVILLASMAGNTAHLVVRRHLQLDWRRWLSVRVIGDWMEEARHYQASLIAGDHANPDGRIAEDIRIATEAAIDLACNLLYCALLVPISFGILWSLSGWIDIAGLLLPGHLVFLAFGYAGAGAVVAFTLGRPLVRATNRRQTKEADFRVGLVRARESGEAIALARGEASERSRLAMLFGTIAQSWHDQSFGLARLLIFSSGYVTLAGVLPILVGTPRFLAGTLSLGGLMQSAQAFQLMTSALSWPVDNLPRIAEWRASVERVLALEEAVKTVALEAARVGDTALNLERTMGGRLGVEELWVAAPDGTTMLSGLNLQAAPGEHVLVDGDPEATAALFRVLAGIWPWGRGRVNLPADAEMMAIGRQPFLPMGTLRQVLAFPEPPGRDEDAALGAALERVGLSHLRVRLDEAADWAQLLSGAELQRLSFARLMLHRPHWIVLGDATDALDPRAADAMMRLLAEVLPKAGIVAIGRYPGSAEAFHRRLTLQRVAGGDVLLHEVYARRQAAQIPRPQPRSVVDWLSQGTGS
jgi:putative ATP-binding cassette transporter